MRADPEATVSPRTHHAPGKQGVRKHHLGSSGDFPSAISSCNEADLSCENPELNISASQLGTPYIKKGQGSPLASAQVSAHNKILHLS